MGGKASIFQYSIRDALGVNIELDEGRHYVVTFNTLLEMPIEDRMNLNLKAVAFNTLLEMPFLLLLAWARTASMSSPFQYSIRDAPCCATCCQRCLRTTSFNTL